MRKTQLHAAIVLAILVSTATLAWAAQASYTPPAEPGLIYTVINFNRANGMARHTRVNVDFGNLHRRLVVSAPYSQSPCSRTTPSGFVLRTRHNQPDSPQLAITTTGTIVRGPYQGEPPLELLNPCYKLVK
jgi:hypothetical protein